MPVLDYNFHRVRLPIFLVYRAGSRCSFNVNDWSFGSSHVDSIDHVRVFSDPCHYHSLLGSVMRHEDVRLLLYSTATSRPILCLVHTRFGQHLSTFLHI